MMPVRATSALVVLVSLSVGCGPGVASNAIDMTGYTPLGVGAKWEYSTSYSHPTTGSGTARSSEEVVGLEELGGRMYYKSVWFTDGFPGARPLITFLRRSDDAIYAVSAEESAKGEHLQIPMRLSLGDSWTIDRFSGAVEYTLRSREKLEVSAGAFTDCLQIVMAGEVSIGGASGEMYLCRGMGMVRQVERFSNGAVFEYELLRYTPGKEIPQNPSTGGDG
jgi:hypothetical protein